MSTENCDTNGCATTSCQSNNKTLKAYHDGCDEGALTTVAELGYHDMEEACEVRIGYIHPKPQQQLTKYSHSQDYSCNIGTAADDAAQLVCTEDEPEDDDDEGGCPEGSFEFLGACGCFSGSSTVQTPSGIKAVSDIQLGDVVLPGIYEPVYGFAHYQPDATVSYLQVKVTTTSTDDTSSSTSTLQVSANHLLQLKSGDYVPAGTLQVADVLKNGQTIDSIETIQSQGIYAPYTPSGTIQIDGIAASCYVVPDTKVWGITFTGHWLAHAFEFPHRLVCHHKILGGEALEECDSYDANGIHVWKYLPLRWADWMFQQSAFVRQLLLAILVIVLAIFALIEALVFENHPGLFVASVMTGVAIVANYRQPRVGTKQVAA